MNACARIKVLPFIKTAIRAYLSAGDCDNEAWPQPYYGWEDAKVFCYTTASGLGRWRVDFSPRGVIAVSFSGRRQSFRDGGLLFGPSEHHMFFGAICVDCTWSYESSTPDVPVWGHIADVEVPAPEAIRYEEDEEEELLGLATLAKLFS